VEISPFCSYYVVFRTNETDAPQHESNSMLSSFTSNKENPVPVLRTRGTKEFGANSAAQTANNAATPAAAPRTFGANLTNQDKAKSRGKAPLQSNKSSQILAPASAASKRRAPTDSIVTFFFFFFFFEFQFSNFFRPFQPDIEYMPNATPYKYEPQLDLEVDLSKPRARLPIVPTVAPRKKAAKALMAPMSMDEFLILDDQPSVDRTSATIAAVAQRAPLSTTFDVPDSIFADDSSSGKP
jgi:hypothetical protein